MTAPTGSVRGLSAPVRELVRARPWTAKPPEPGTHGHIADSGGPPMRLGRRMRWSAGGDLGGAFGL